LALCLQPDILDPGISRHRLDAGERLLFVIFEVVSSM